MDFSGILKKIKKEGVRMAFYADAYAQTLSYIYEDEGGKHITSSVAVPFGGRLDEDYFASLKEALSGIRRSGNFAKTVPVNLVLPDRMFFFDVVKLPAAKKQKGDDALEVSLRNIYRNRSELNIKYALAGQNKQNLTYTTVGIKRGILADFYAAFSQTGFSVRNTTHASGALAAALAQSSMRAKGTSYLTMRIGERSAACSVVAKGKTVGVYQIPFGYSILFDDRIEAENMLFEHTESEIVVLNAIERAKQKNLTVLRDLSEEDNDEDEEGGENAPPAKKPKYLAKKTPRRLPKYMQRPEPLTAEGFVYENFRYFVKQALELIGNNPSLTAIGSPDAVLVDLPEKFSYLLEMANAEEEENGVRFVKLSVTAQHADVTALAELYGGLALDRFHQGGSF